MNPLKSLLQILKDRSARKAERKARARLQQIVDQTLASREHQNFLDRRRAALKGLAIKRVRQHG